MKQLAYICSTFQSTSKRERNEKQTVYHYITFTTQINYNVRNGKHFHFILIKQDSVHFSTTIMAIVIYRYCWSILKRYDKFKSAIDSFFIFQYVNIFLQSSTDSKCILNVLPISLIVSYGINQMHGNLWYDVWLLCIFSLFHFEI